MAGQGSMRLLLAVLLIAAVACSDDRDRPAPLLGVAPEPPPGGDAPPATGLDYQPPPRVDVMAAGFPRDPAGRAILFEVPGASLRFDPDASDAITALGDCSRWVLSCVGDGAGSIDECVAGPPVCATERPWEEAGTCCAAACASAYAAARSAGTDAVDALLTTYFGSPSCMPGVDALRAGGSS